MSDPFNAFVHAAPDEPRNTLSLGLSIAVKDNVDVLGLPTRGASPALPDEPAAADAPVVAAVRAAGMRIAGKANMHELAFGITSDNPWAGRVDNPALPGHLAGGSSGGNAAAIAGGLVDAGIGSDTGGSTRIPAAFCGIAGFRPSTGRYSADGVLLLSTTFDTVGPMGRTARDLDLLDAAVTGRPPVDAAPLRGVRLAVPRAYYWDDAEPAVAAACEAALARLCDAGCVLVERDVPGLVPSIAAWHLTIVLHEAQRIWTGYAAGLGRSLAELAAEISTPGVRAIFESLAAGDVPGDDAYRSALAQRDAMRATILDYVGDADAIAAPAVPIEPPRAEPRSPDAEIRLFELVTRNMLPATIVAGPSVCLPVGGDGPPVGLLLDARPGNDERLLALALAVEAL
jgi:indoleacetamide hydrolase